MKLFFTVWILMITVSCCGQMKEKFNLGFETQNADDNLPKGWFQWGDYMLSVDSLARTGTKAGKITSDENGNFGSIAYKIPAKYEGKSITLEGYMKIKEVQNGFAGLLMRIDGNGSTLAFDNMQSQNITGTHDWKKYTITFNYPDEAQYIYVAGILVGKGEVWFDDFTLTIDGENVQNLKEIEKQPTKAELDKEFDSGSMIELSNVTYRDIENLELLGRIWGFLKYHHPEIAKGNYNWDYELFRFLPKFIKSKTNGERDEHLINWVSSLGTLEECSDCKSISESAVIKPDLEWIKGLDDPLKNKLLEVYNSRSQGSQYYIDMAPSVGNPVFKNEDAYYLMPFPDDGVRLLALYRYWNMIHYFFPYKHLMDKDWNTILAEYIPLFLNAKDELEYELTSIKLIGDIQDTHANIWVGAAKVDKRRGVNYPPVHVRFVEGQLVVTDFYNEEYRESTGLQIGDVISKINEVPVSTLVKERAKYYPASNHPTMLRNIGTDLLRSNDDEIEINIESDNTSDKLQKLKLYPKDSLDLYLWHKRDDRESYKMIDSNIGYVTLQTIKEEDIPKIKEQFKNTKGIIIDIRNYPSTFVPFSLGSYFVSNTTPFVKFTVGSVDNPGEFVFTENLEIPSSGDVYKGKLVVLVNELTQSMAEYTSMAFRAGDNTTIIGSTTAGADGNVSTIYLPGGMRTNISGIGVYYPDGEETQRIGIVPDIEVHPTVEGIREGKDELLEKAIEIITKD
ncbi:peptidase S41 [Muricauda sp. CAU 1633]|uniref:S41 family peptidase n=1 Tax=Allomuricauda sp. CAU 1633 TaxID=2816036 RepID=UPI001A8F964B|nr:S41 family peptidase [Muricauda sp. CAU 1633]MBO0323651.1 peptidase S41 [Muricauda sp. CAU 1633]